MSDLSRTKTSATTQGSEGPAPSAERVDPVDGEFKVDVEVSPNPTL